MSAISEQIANRGIEFLDTAIKLAENQIPQLVSQFLDYMLFVTILDLIRSLAWGLLIVVVWKVWSAVIQIKREGLKEDSVRLQELDRSVQSRTACTHPKEQFQRECYGCNSAKRDLDRAKGEFFHSRADMQVHVGLRFVSCFLISLWLLSGTFNNFARAGKILIAPKVFLVQEGAALLKTSHEAHAK